MAIISSQCIKPFTSKTSRRSHLPRRTSPSSSDPTSPKVGCMGQVRRCRSVSAVALPPPPKQPSGRGLYFIVASAAFFFISPIKCGRPAKIKNTPRVQVKGSRVAAVEVIEPSPPMKTLEELDPPLPVVVAGKEDKLAGRPAESLWKRRCRSGRLEQLFCCQRERLPAVIASTIV